MEIIALNNELFLERLRVILPEPENFYPLHEPKFDQNTALEVKKCVETGWVSSSGKNITELEKVCEEILSVKHCIAVSSGTAALHLAYFSAGIENGSEVFCPGISFVATANALRYLNAQPYFIDIDRDTLCMSADALMSEIDKNCEFSKGHLKNKKNGRKISAIVIVNAFGNSPDISKISKIAASFNLKLIEDAAGAFGSKYKDKTPGYFSDVATYSFNGNKIFTAGAGGLIVTNNDEVSEKVRHLGTTAKLPHAWDYIHDEVGFNYRMPNLNASLLLPQIKNLNQVISKKRRLHSMYSDVFRELNVKLISEAPNCFSNYWLICVDLKLDDIDFRNSILRYLNDNNIMARPLWTPLYNLAPYEHSSRGVTKNCENAFLNILNIPSSPHLI